MRALPLALILAVLSASPAVAATRVVKVGDNFFKPKRATVAKGTVVKWRWVGESPHNVTVVRGPVRFRSDPQVSGTFKRRMKRRGTYKIVCTIHEGMRMTLRVT